jgi:hypothetical protein
MPGFDIPGLMASKVLPNCTVFFVPGAVGPTRVITVRVSLDSLADEDNTFVKGVDAQALKGIVYLLSYQG